MATLRWLARLNDVGRILLVLLWAGFVAAEPSPSPQLFPTTLKMDTSRGDSPWVPLAWHELERFINDAFHPPVAAVAVGSAPRALAEQVLMNAPQGPARTRNEPPPDAQAETAVDDQVEATHLAARRPRHWRSVEIEVRLDRLGRLQSARVTAPSQDSRLDDAALAAVGQALDHHPIAGPDGQYLARFQISAARSVTPLDLAPVTDPLTRRRMRGIVPKMRFQFDESSGKIEPEKPLSQKLHTEVKLLSLTPIP
jgi:TonB family protein